MKFVIQNTEGSSAGPSVNNLPITGGFCDPFTGGSGSTDTPMPQAPSLPRPPVSTTYDITGGGVDPFTGGGGGSRPAATAGGGGGGGGSGQFPARSFLLFDAAPPADALKKKLVELNARVAAAAGEMALSSEEMEGEGNCVVRGWGIDCALREIGSQGESIMLRGVLRRKGWKQNARGHFGSSCRRIILASSGGVVGCVLELALVYHVVTHHVFWSSYLQARKFNVLS